MPYNNFGNGGRGGGKVMTYVIIGAVLLLVVLGVVLLFVFKPWQSSDETETPSGTDIPWDNIETGSPDPKSGARRARRLRAMKKSQAQARRARKNTPKQHASRARKVSKRKSKKSKKASHKKSGG